MSSASQSHPLNDTVRGRSGGFGIITLTIVLVEAVRALWLLASGSALPTPEFVILTSLAILFGVLATDQRRFMLHVSAHDLEIWHGKRLRRLALNDIGALSLHVTGGRYVDQQLVCWDRDGNAVERLSLQPFRRAALRELIIQLHQAYPSIQLDHGLTHYLQLDRALL